MGVSKTMAIAEMAEKAISVNVVPAPQATTEGTPKGGLVRNNGEDGYYVVLSFYGIEGELGHCKAVLRDSI
jgi:hypothetical protein